MYLILQQDKAEDYVIATGITNTVREFARLAFAETGIYLRFEGEGEAEKEIIDDIDQDVVLNLSKESLSGDIPILSRSVGETVISEDPNYFRPTEVDQLVGNANRDKIKLGWEPKYTVNELVNEMVREDIRILMNKHSLSFTTLNQGTKKLNA